MGVENNSCGASETVSGDGRSSRCCTVGEFLHNCDSVSVRAVQEKCDEKGTRPDPLLTLIVTYSNIRLVYKVVTTRSFAKALSRLPVNLQKRIVEKIKAVAADPYASHNNVTKLQGRDGYRLRIGDWRVIYELHDDRLELWALEVGPRGGIY